MIWVVLRRVLLVLVVLISVTVLYFGATFVQIWLRGHEHSTASAQAILVFGTTEDNGTPSPELQRTPQSGSHRLSGGPSALDRGHRGTAAG